MCALGPVACMGACAHVRGYGCACVCVCVCARVVWRADGPCPTLGTPQQARHRDHIVGVTRLTLEAVELDPGSHYEARLRVQMATPEDDMMEELRYEGQWSEWSQSACFPSPQSPARGGGLLPEGLSSLVCHTPPPPSWNPLPEAVVPQLTTLRWRSEIFEEETNTCQVLGFLEPVVIVCHWK